MLLKSEFTRSWLKLAELACCELWRRALGISLLVGGTPRKLARGLHTGLRAGGVDRT